MTDDGDRRLSEAAQDLDDHVRGLASDLGPSDVRKKPRHGRFSFLWYVLLLAAIGILLVIIARPNLLTGESAAVTDSATESTATDQDAAPSEPASDTAGSVRDPAASISDTAGPISGTWAMYWTNTEGSESQAFTITFTGSDTGTLEVLNDDTESQTGFTVEGDQVRFKFTRTFERETGDWPEGSTFEGTLAGRNEMTGVWERQGWECSPDTGCRYTGNWSPHDARLIRISE